AGRSTAGAWMRTASPPPLGISHPASRSTETEHADPDPRDLDARLPVVADLARRVTKRESPLIGRCGCGFRRMIRCRTQRAMPIRQPVPQIEMPLTRPFAGPHYPACPIERAL